MISGTLERISRRLVADIEGRLQRVGILFRIFGRVKDSNSLLDKLAVKNYGVSGKLLQDMVGIRVAAYFNDDVKLIYRILSECFELLDETIDVPKDDNFSPERHNLVFRIPSAYIEDFQSVIKDPLIDTTFELQIRTVLSEGWHEVEHDLRYKCKAEWLEHSDLSRVLNGIWATLSNCDWSMISLFDNLAYRNYKNHQWKAMLRNKFRIRILKSDISGEINCYLNDLKNGFGKKLFRIDRNLLLNDMYASRAVYPLTYDNLIYLLNTLLIKDEYIRSLTPEIILDELS